MGAALSREQFLDHAAVQRFARAVDSAEGELGAHRHRVISRTGFERHEQDAAFNNEVAPLRHQNGGRAFLYSKAAAPFGHASSAIDSLKADFFARLIVVSALNLCLSTESIWARGVRANLFDERLA